MDELIQISTTAGTQNDAERIAVELISRRLAACVQLVGPIRSHFRWQGELEDVEEWLCVAKTTRACFARIETLLAEVHPYDVPELIATPILTAGEGYGRWVREEVEEG